MNPQDNTPQSTSIPPLSPASGYTPAAASVPPPPPPPPEPVAPMPAPGSNKVFMPTKKPFPKKILFILIGVIALLAMVFLATKLLPGGAVQEEAALTWWGLWEDESAIAPLIAEYQQQHPNVKIVYERQSPQDYRERLVNSLSQGKGPDIFRIHNSWIPMFRGGIAPLPDSVMSSSEYKQTFYPVAVSDFTDLGSGNLLAIPLEVDTIALFINEEIFETQLKTIPTTWDDFLNVATELTIKDENGVIRQSGAAMGRTENVDHWQEIVALIMLQNGVKLSNPTGLQAQQVIDYYSRFSGRIWDTSLPSSTQMFSSGKLAMYFGPSWRVHEIRLANPDLRFKVVPVPQLPKQNASDPNIYYATYWAESVWSESKNPTAAWDFLKFMSTKESLEKFYSNTLAGREFGEPYSRVDMQQLLLPHPYVGTFVAQANEAKSWYLQSRTFDGPTGINGQVGKYFENAINKVSNGGSPQDALKTTGEGIPEILAKYGISAQR